MVLSLLLIIVGFVALIFGANWVVDGASALAKKHNISDLVIGLTIVAFGTSAPELVVNSVASVNGFSDIIMGNIIGSNNFNLFVILGIAALIYPIAVESSTAKREIPLSLIIAVALFALANDFFLNSNTAISRLDGGILLLAFVGFLYYIFKQMKTEKPQEISEAHKSNFQIWKLIIVGLAGLVIGGKLVVDHSVNIAADLGVSQKIIGLTIVAAGTSLPELMTSVVAAMKKNSAIAIGNVIGSNIFNVLLVIGVSALLNPMAYNPNFNLDFTILIGGTAFLILTLFTGKKGELGRWGAAVLVAFYLFYLIYLVSKEL